MDEEILKSLVQFLIERIESDPEEIVEWFVMDTGHNRDDVYRAMSQDEEES